MSLRLINPEAASYATIAQNPYCDPATVESDSCLVAREHYVLVACDAAVGLKTQWAPPLTASQMGKELAGYTLTLRYNNDLNPEP